MREAARPTAGPPRTTRPPERALGRPRPSWGCRGWGCGALSAAIPACPREALLGVRHGPPTRHRHRHRRMPSRGEAVARLPPGRPSPGPSSRTRTWLWPACRPGDRTGCSWPPLRHVDCPPCLGGPVLLARGGGLGGTRVPQGPGWLPARARLPAGVCPRACLRGGALPGRASGAPVREEPSTPGATPAPGRGAPPGGGGDSRATPCWRLDLRNVLWGGRPRPRRQGPGRAVRRPGLTAPWPRL